MWASRRVLLWTTVAADGMVRGPGWSGRVKLVVDMAAYRAVISTTVFTLPDHLGPLAIPSAATVVQRSTLRDAHIEDL